jgi:hypothetical protein
MARLLTIWAVAVAAATFAPVVGHPPGTTAGWTILALEAVLFLAIVVWTGTGHGHRGDF